MNFFLYGGISFFLTIFFIKLLKPTLYNYFLDNPVERSSHTTPIPTGAGISFVIASIVSVILFKWYIPLICFPLAFVGFIDDKLNLSSFFRYAIQIFTAIVLIKTSLETNINLIFLKEFNLINIVIIIILILVITAIINFSNFMDGLDGLLGGAYFVAFLYLTITYEQNLIVLTSSIFAFLIFNWHPAKVFMGDVGSTFLGALYAGLVIQEGDFFQIVTKLLIISPILMDSFFTLIRRIINKQNIFRPHKLHVYQRLSQSGISDDKVSLIYAFGVLILCLVKYLSNIYYLFLFVFLEFLIGLYLSSIASKFKNNYY